MDNFMINHLLREDFESFRTLRARGSVGHSDDLQAHRVTGSDLRTINSDMDRTDQRSFHCPTANARYPENDQFYRNRSPEPNLLLMVRL